MNKQEYKDYQAEFSAFMTREGINNLDVIRDKNGNVDEFSSSCQCDACGTSLYGYRVHASGFRSTKGGIGEYIICTDCEYYAEYGQLDDMTMMEIDNG